MLSHCQPYRKSTCHQQFNVHAYAHWIVDPARISSFERTPLGVSLMEILTINASQQGWGFVGKPESITKMEKPGTMSVYIGNFHISAFSKMKTVRLALQHFHKLLKGSHVLVWTCNITVVFYINLKRCWGQLWPILIELNLLCQMNGSMWTFLKGMECFRPSCKTVIPQVFMDRQWKWQLKGRWQCFHAIGSIIRGLCCLKTFCKGIDCTRIINANQEVPLSIVYYSTSSMDTF